MELKTWMTENFPAQFKLKSAAEKVLVCMLDKNKNVCESNRIKDIWHSYIWYNYMLAKWSYRDKTFWKNSGVKQLMKLNSNTDTLTMIHSTRSIIFHWFAFGVFCLFLFLNMWIAFICFIFAIWFCCKYPHVVVVVKYRWHIQKIH